MRVVGYIRVSTSEQGDSGLGLEAQRATLAAEAEKRGYELVTIYEEVASGASLRGRDGVKEALAAVESGEVDGLIVTRLDRLSRSTLDFARILERFRAKGWNLICLDLGVDTSTAMGEAMAGMAVVFAQVERRLIGERTKAALAVKRERMRESGKSLGRPRILDDSLRQRIVALRESGETFARIAETLNSEGVPTAQGGARWYPATVRKVTLTA